MLPKYLDNSRDPLPPTVDESTQTIPEERAERRDRFQNRSSGSGAQTSPVQPRNTENSTSPEELVLSGREVETERSTWPDQRISGKRAVDEETTSSVKKNRIASSDLSLKRSPSESPVTMRWFVCETRDNLRTAQMNRARECAWRSWKRSPCEWRPWSNLSIQQ